MNIESFDSFDEMPDYLITSRNKADSRVQFWQAAIKPGDYFRRNTPQGFYIYGEILEDDEPREVELQHYRFCMAYSIACPLGEMGDIHVSTIERLLLKEEFEAARKRGWQPE